MRNTITTSANTSRPNDWRIGRPNDWRLGRPNDWRRC